MNQVIIEGRDLKRFYQVGGGMFSKASTVKALNGLSFTLEAGKTLAVVGESGCGKSTLARLVTMIEEPTEGALAINGQKADPGVRDLRSTVQIVFQNPYGSLNPRKKIGEILMEPLVINGKFSADERRTRAMAMLKKVGLEEKHYTRYPHMFSGGQRQRVAIARALMLNPRLLVLDEPVSALDLSVQAQVLNLLQDLQDEFHLTYVFISHDLSVVRHIADDVMVMYYGEAVEHGPRDEVFNNPQHSYTKTLFAATPRVDVEAIKARVASRKRAA